MTKDKDNKSQANPMMSLMKKSAKASNGGAAKVKMNYQEALKESTREQEEKDQEELQEAKKNAKAKLSASNSPELIKAKIISAIIKYSIIILMATLLGLGLFRSVTGMFGSDENSEFYDSLNR